MTSGNQQNIRFMKTNDADFAHLSKVHVSCSSRRTGHWRSACTIFLCFSSSQISTRIRQWAEQTCIKPLRFICPARRPRGRSAYVWVATASQASACTTSTMSCSTTSTQCQAALAAQEAAPVSGGAQAIVVLGNGRRTSSRIFEVLFPGRVAHASRQTRQCSLPVLPKRGL